MKPHVPLEILLRQLDLWYHTSLGSAVFAAEHDALSQHLPHYFGQHLLQIGGPSERWLFDQSPIYHRVRLSPEHMPVFRGPSVQGAFDELPFLPDSFAVILLPHVLEFVTKPDAVLQQIYPLLTPEGRVIVVGFNPCSLWGIAKWFKHHKTLPWRGQFISKLWLCNVLKKQGLAVEKVSTVFFRPPVTRKQWLQRLLPLEAMGRLLWSDCGAVYIIIAKKIVASLTPVDERLKQKAIGLGELAPPVVPAKHNVYP